MWRAAILLLLAGCGAAPQVTAPGGGAAPRSVTLFRDTVTVEMNDGALCTGPRRGRAGPWSTTLGGCPHPWPVDVLRPTTRPRLPLAPGTDAPWVTLTPPAGEPLGFGPRAPYGA